VVWKWELHTGSEVEAMRTRWNGGGNSGARGAEGLHYRSESSSERRVIQA